MNIKDTWEISEELYESAHVLPVHDCMKVHVRRLAMNLMMFQPFTAKRAIYDTFNQNLNLNLRRDHQKFFLWVGKRKEPILGYVLKNYEKRIQAVKG